MSRVQKTYRVDKRRGAIARVITEQQSKCLQNFIETRSPCSDYTLIRVKGDGACGFRSLAQGLSMTTNFFSKKDNNVDEYLTDVKTYIADKALSDPNSTKLNDLVSPDFEISMSLKQNNSRARLPNELSVGEETVVARALQNNLKTWVMDHQEDTTDSGETIKDVTLNTHESVNNMKSYGKLYGHFAGDPNFKMVKIIHRKKHKKPIRNLHRMEPIAERWCGMSEQIAFTKFHDISIKIYTAQTLNSECKIVPSHFQPSGKSRLYHISTFGDTNKPNINLLQTMTCSGYEHYDLLVENRISNT